MKADVVCYVSGHGFGHATRIAALVAELCAPSAHPVVAVRSEAPPWIFTSRVADVAVSAAAIDVGVVQHNGLDIDRAATLAAQRRFAEAWPATLAHEATWLDATGARLVVADVPAIAFAAAERVGVPAVAVANFSWDWIFAPWIDEEPAYREIVARHRDAYATASLLYRLPLHGDLSAFDAIEDVPLLVNRCARSTAQCRAAAGIAPDETRRIVLFSFGGMGSGALRTRTASSDLDGYLFVGVGSAPEGFPGAWHGIAGGDRIPHEDLIQACDAVVGKPGFSTVAEVLAHERRMLYLRRADFAENDVLVRGLHALGCAREMPRDDFRAGRWSAHLDALFAQPDPASAPPSDGATVIARALRERLA